MLFIYFSLGPRQIRTESCMLRPYNNATGAAPFESLMVADIGDIPINTYNLASTVDIIHKHIATIASHGCKPLILGGDHTITYPILQGIKVSDLYYYYYCHQLVNSVVGGDRRAVVQEKRDGRLEKRGWEAGVPWWWEPGEIEKKFFQHFVIFCNRNGTKRRGELRKVGGKWE